MSRAVSFTRLPEIRRRDSADRMPIEELARRTGVTVRNLRALQARSLLEPPELVGRKGFYTARHEARVLLVLKLQSRGFSLASIRALIEGWQAGGGILDVMGLEDALLTPGAPGIVREANAADVFPELLRNRRALAKALEQELVIEREGRYVAPNAELLGIVKQEVAAGFPLDAVLTDGGALLADLERIASRFRQSFFEHVVGPHLEQGSPAAGLPDLAAKVALLRPLAVRLVAILLARAIERGGGPVVPNAANGRDERKPRSTKKKRTERSTLRRAARKGGR